MRKFESEKDLKDLFDCRNREKPFALIIGGSWCSNCHMLINALDATPETDLPVDVDLYYYEMETQDIPDDSFVKKDLDEITGSPVMTLPYIVYAEAGLSNIKTGGMLPVSMFIDKLEKLAESNSDDSNDESAEEDGGCATCHL
ncbi:MAG: hypothetical protein J5614_00495 [Paludibacteraceae bacterium]|nr:hypothetical protein [Paludibacteraceae bacterium]